ncbi:hypothetical protein Tco_0180932 [Tanacetum coccineum]
MSGICGEMMILGKPFLATIHAQIYVFNGEISFGTSEDRVKFNVNRISHHSNATLEKVYMTTEKESFNPLEIEDGLFSYESPACLRFEQNTRIHTNSDNETIDSPTNMQETSKSGEDCGIWPTCNPDLSFCSGYEAVYGRDSFDVEADYANMFANPYSRRFDEYKRIFINEVEQLSNEYELKIGKKKYVLDDVWENVNKTTGVQHTHGTMKDMRKKNFGNVGLTKPNMRRL